MTVQVGLKHLFHKNRLFKFKGHWFTFDLEVGRTFGVGSSVCNLACHGHFAVVQNQRVFASLLNDINVLSNEVICHCTKHNTLNGHSCCAPY